MLLVLEQLPPLNGKALTNYFAILSLPRSLCFLLTPNLPMSCSSQETGKASSFVLKQQNSYVKKNSPLHPANTNFLHPCLHIRMCEIKGYKK